MAQHGAIDCTSGPRCTSSWCFVILWRLSQVSGACWKLWWTLHVSCQHGQRSHISSWEYILSWSDRQWKWVLGRHGWCSVSVGRVTSSTLHHDVSGTSASCCQIGYSFGWHTPTKWSVLNEVAQCQCVLHSLHGQSWELPETSSPFGSDCPRDCTSKLFSCKTALPTLPVYEDEHGTRRIMLRTRYQTKNRRQKKTHSTDWTLSMDLTSIRTVLSTYFMSQ